jgi:hypothetical protein
MSFDALIQKVKQAEAALEAKERQTAADWRQLKSSWRSLWTPGRIVLGGLVAGFMVGRAEPFKRAAGGGALQLLSALSGLFAGGSAQVAANEAGDAADSAQQASAATAGAPPQPQPARPGSPSLSPEETQQRYREAGLP